MTTIPLGKIAGSAAIIDDNKILLIKRSRDTSLFPGYWTFPSGGIEETDSSVCETVIREVKEETGLNFEPTKRFGFYESLVNGKRYFALVHLGTWSGTFKLQTEEALEWRFFTYEETRELSLAFAYREVIDDLRVAGLIN